MVRLRHLLDQELKDTDEVGVRRCEILHYNTIDERLFCFCHLSCYGLLEASERFLDFLLEDGQAIDIELSRRNRV